MTIDSHNQSLPFSPATILQETISLLKEYELRPDITKEPKLGSIQALRKEALEIIALGSANWTSSTIIKLRKDIISLWNILLRLKGNLKTSAQLCDICFLLMKFNIITLSKAGSDQDLLLTLLQMSTRTGLSFVERRDEANVSSYIAMASDILRDFGTVGRRMKIVLEEEKSNYMLLKLLHHSIIKEDPQSFISVIKGDAVDVNSIILLFIKELPSYSKEIPIEIQKIIISLPLPEDVFVEFYLTFPSYLPHPRKECKKINLLTNILFEETDDDRPTAPQKDLLPLIKKIPKDNKDNIKNILSYIHRNSSIGVVQRRTLPFILLQLQLIDTLYPLGTHNPLPHFLLALEGVLFGVDDDSNIDGGSCLLEKERKNEIENEIINIIIRRVKTSKSALLFNLLEKIPQSKKVIELTFTKLIEFKRCDEAKTVFASITDPSPVLQIRHLLCSFGSQSKDYLLAAAESTTTTIIPKNLLNSIAQGKGEEEEEVINLLLENDLFEEVIYLLTKSGKTEAERVGRIIILTDGIDDLKKKKEIVMEMLPLLLEKVIDTKSAAGLGLLFKRNIMNSCWNFLCDLRGVGDCNNIVKVCDWSIQLLDVFFNLQNDIEGMDRFTLFNVVLVESIIGLLDGDKGYDDNDDNTLLDDEDESNNINSNRAKKKYINNVKRSLEHLEKIDISTTEEKHNFKDLLKTFLFINDCKIEIEGLEDESLMVVLKILLEKCFIDEKVYVVLDLLITRGSVGGGSSSYDVLMLLRGRIIICKDDKETISLVEKGLEIAQLSNSLAGCDGRDDEIAWLIVHCYNITMKDDIDPASGRRLCQLSLALCTLLGDGNNQRSQYEEEIRKLYCQLLI